MESKADDKQTPAEADVSLPSGSLSLGVALLVSTAMEASLALRFLMASRRRRKNLLGQSLKDRGCEVEVSFRAQSGASDALPRTFSPCSGGSVGATVTCRQSNAREAGSGR